MTRVGEHVAIVQEVAHAKVSRVSAVVRRSLLFAIPGAEYTSLFVRSCRIEVGQSQKQTPGMFWVIVRQ